ncbi:hypothetical protein MTO96_041085, partial [Rhipicephalus appendiculatus]
MHLSSIATTTVRVSSPETPVDFVKRMYSGMPTNTKFYVICLLSHKEYLRDIFPVGYVLLGPSNAKRNNCSGLLTIAQRKKKNGSSPIKLASPAKEERSNVLALTCGPTGVLDARKLFCYPPSLEEFLQVMESYLNITARVNIIAPKPTVSNGLFPEEDTYSGQLTHGMADMRCSFVAMYERRTFSTDFIFPLDFYRLNYVYPSPRMLKSSLTALKIFSVT